MCVSGCKVKRQLKRPGESNSTMKEALLPGLAGLALFLPGERGEWGNDRANNQVVVSGGSCNHHPALACLLFRATYILGLLNMRIRNSWGNLGLIINKLFYGRIFEYLSKVDKPSSSVNQVVANRRLRFWRECCAIF